MAKARRTPLFVLPEAEGEGVPTPEEMALCGRCPLAGGLGVPAEVVGDGRLFIIGEAPGANEAQQGRPFVGVSGQLLRSLLRQCGATDYVLTNVVRHRPPNNRTPEDGEVTACLPYLARELAAVRPGAIVLVGEVAMRLVWRARGQVKRHHGRWGQLQGVPAVGMVHPAAILRMGEPQRSMWVASSLSILAQAWAKANGWGPSEARWRLAGEGERLPATVAPDQGDGRLPLVGVDCEADSVDPRSARLLMVAAAREDCDETVVWRGAPPPGVEGRLVMHHSAYDASLLARLGVLDLRRADLDDSMVLAHVVGCPDLSLKSLSTRLLREPMETFEDLFGQSITYDQLQEDDALFHRLASYCARDARQTVRLFRALWRQAMWGDMEVYRQVERPLLPVVADMTVSGGFQVDREGLSRLADRLEAELAAADEEFAAAAGQRINLASGDQLEAVLRKLGLPLKKLTASGRRYVVDEATLRGLRDVHPAIAPALRHAELRKLLGTYVRPLCHQERLTSLWHQVGTRTGRFSSSDRNLQNIPSAIKPFLTARPGRVLVRLDLSQIELRVAAHLSREPVLLGAFRAGRDIHQETQDALGLPDRRLAKVFNFGLIYGAGPDRLVEQARLYDVALSLADASRFHQAMRQRFATYFAWAEQVGRQALAREPVSGLYGRLFRFPPPTDPAERSRLLRQAANYPIQGGAVDITKRLMAVAWRELGRPILAQVHDEVVFEVAPEEADDFLDALRGLLLRENPLDVPLAAEFSTGYRWKDA